MRIKIFIILLLGALIFTCPPISQSKVSNGNFPSASIAQFGYYEFFVETKKYKADYSLSGYAQKDGEPILIEQTSKIPLKKGRLMAFFFSIKDLPSATNKISLAVTIDHPEFVKQDGSKSSQLRKEITLNVTNGLAARAEGYRFDHDYELVEGKWTFTIKYLDRVLLIKEFETFLP